MRTSNIPKSGPPVNQILSTMPPGPDLGLNGFPPIPDVLEVLAKPQKLKKWSSDLISIVKSQQNDVFREWGMEKSHLTRADLFRSLEKMKSCGSVLEIRERVNRGTGEVGPHVLHAGNFCQQPTICPCCAGRVQDRRKAIWRKPIYWASAKYQHAYMITATLPPAATWREHLEAMRKAWRAFYRMGQIRKGKGRDPGEFSKIKAALVKYELKRGKGSHLPHVHIHGLFFTNEYLDFRIYRDKRNGDMTLVCDPVEEDGKLKKMSKFSTEWYRASGGTAKNIDAKYLDEKSGREKLRRKFGDAVDKWDRGESIFHQGQEVLKYATKFDSNPDYESDRLFTEDFISIKDATYNKRLFLPYGAFRKDYRKDPEDVCPCLWEGDEFSGGGPHILEQPNIYSARWRDKRYSELIPEFHPVFRGSDMTLFNQFQRTMCARVMGRFRRIRTAILKAKDDYAAGLRDLSPIEYEMPVYGPDGHPEFNVVRREIRGDVRYQMTPIVRAAAMEIPAAVLAAPADFSTWEAWLDEYTEASNRTYLQLKEAIYADHVAAYNPKENWEIMNKSRALNFAALLRDPAQVAKRMEKIVNAFLEILQADVKLYVPYPLPVLQP